MTAKPPTLVLDLDGTLVDTAPDLMAALNYVLERNGFSPLGLDTAKSMIGAGARALLERGLKAVGAEKTDQDVDVMFEDFFGHYTEHIADGSRPYPGVVEAIDRFVNRNWRVAVCTNKLEGMSRQLLSELGIAGRFDAIAGGDSFDVKKPDPRHLLQTIVLAGGDPGNAVMVGDSETDIATAKAAEVPVVAVDFGYSVVPVAEFTPDSIISHFDALDEAVAGLIGGAVG